MDQCYGVHDTSMGKGYKAFGDKPSLSVELAFPARHAVWRH